MMKKRKDSFEKEWKQWSDMMNSLPVEIRANSRLAAAYSIMKSGMLPEGCGISSSDINHELFSLWKESGKDLPQYLHILVELFASRERMKELMA